MMPPEQETTHITGGNTTPINNLYIHAEPPNSPNNVNINVVPCPEDLIPRQQHQTQPKISIFSESLHPVILKVRTLMYTNMLPNFIPCTKVYIHALNKKKSHSY